MSNGLRLMIASGIAAKVQSYIDGVLDGTIIAPETVKMAVNRHVIDLGRQSTQGFHYHFNPKKAAKVCEFFPAVL